MLLDTKEKVMPSVNFLSMSVYRVCLSLWTGGRMVLISDDPYVWLSLLVEFVKVTNSVY